MCQDVGDGCSRASHPRGDGQSSLPLWHGARGPLQRQVVQEWPRVLPLHPRRSRTTNHNVSSSGTPGGEVSVRLQQGCLEEREPGDDCQVQVRGVRGGPVVQHRVTEQEVASCGSAWFWTENIWTQKWARLQTWWHHSVIFIWNKTIYK